jgi:hypothetical protein
LSWLSNGEFVIRAAAVAYYGSPFFELLNAMRLPQGGFRDGGFNRINHLVERITHFRDGGIVLPQIHLPAFASGGIVSTDAKRAGGGPTSTVHVHIGNKSFGPMTASQDVAKELERAAVRQQVSATGKRPGWNK